MNFKKRIADPIHGSIPLSELEISLINTPAFLRLRDIRQLGLAYFVYPHADFSRFAHSLGVCHVAGRFLEGIKKHKEFDKKEIQKYRIAALLHDIGHYPFSHVIDYALDELREEQVEQGELITLVEENEQSQVPQETKIYLDHEKVGKLLLLNDCVVSDLLKKYSYDPAEIASIFTRETPAQEKAGVFVNLVSSEIDADRVDYLMRTAHVTGLPYGMVDLEYLLYQMKIDKEGRICFSGKAQRTIEHFLLSRYFQYLQVSYHKTVVAFELILKDIFCELVRKKWLSLEKSDIENMIGKGRWERFTDSSVLDKVWEQEQTEGLKDKVNVIRKRWPPKMVWVREVLGDNSKNGTNDFNNMADRVRSAVGSFWEKKGLTCPNYTWAKSVPIVKLEQAPSYNYLEDNIKDREKYEDSYLQSARIWDEEVGSSRVLVDLDNSVIKILAKNVLRIIRVYVVPPAQLDYWEKPEKKHLLKELHDHLNRQ